MSRWVRRPRRPEVTPLPTVAPGQVGISFSGHATVLLRYADRNIVCDPMLGKWVKGVKRAVGPGLTPADLHDVDTILISHAHQDHLHRPTLATLPRSATVILPPRSAQLVSDLGFARVVELAPEQSIQDHGVDITTARVRHGEGDADMTLSYIIRGPGPSVYFCGDSGYFSGFADIGRRYAPDIALLPIGGYAPLSFRDRHMSPLDALYGLEDLGARVMIPIHHGAFSLSYERLDEPIRWLEELVQERGLEDFVIPLEPGESRVFVPPSVDHARDPRNTGAGSTVGAGGSRDNFDMAPVRERRERGLLPELVPAALHPLPAMRAFQRPGAVATGPAPKPVADADPIAAPDAHRPARPGEPAWAARGRLPHFADLARTRPAFDLALQESAAADVEQPADAIPQERPAEPSLPLVVAVEREPSVPVVPFPAPVAVPDLVTIEPVSAAHSEPIELTPKRRALHAVPAFG
jgi:L-ascorbate metabolism protein UlaG (beta-lactamase superfamily)